MAIGPALLDRPPRTVLGHLWCSLLAGAVSGAVVGALGGAIGALQRALDDVGHLDLLAGIQIPTVFATAAGMGVGLAAGLATLRQRGRLDAALRRSTARILALVVAVPSGVLLVPFWEISATSTWAYALALLGRVLYCGLATYVAATAGLRFVLGPERPAEVSPGCRRAPREPR